MSKTDFDKKERTIFIGDNQGCYDELKKLLKKVEYDAASYRLISLGDLIHKGPKSAKVINFFYKKNVDSAFGSFCGKKNTRLI